MKRLLVCLLLVGVVGCGSGQLVSIPGSAQNDTNLSACSDCKREVSIRATTCPHCGAPLDFEAEAIAALDGVFVLDGDSGIDRNEDGKVIALKCNNGLSSSHMKYIRRLTCLRYLDLSSCSRLSPTDFVHLKGLTDLEKLNLWGVNVGDSGLLNLKGMTKLKTLYIPDANITDAGLEHLKGLKSLRHLLYAPTLSSRASRKNRLTDAAIDRLQKALPDCSLSDGRF